MIEINEAEEKTLLAYLESNSVAMTMSMTCRCRDAVLKNLLRMSNVGLLTKTGRSSYATTHKEYIVVKVTENNKPGPKPKSYYERGKVNIIPPHVTDTHKTYIRTHYGKVTRTELAKQVGLNKVDLNNTIIGLGLSREKTEVEYEHNRKTKSA